MAGVLLLFMKQPMVVISVSVLYKLIHGTFNKAVHTLQPGDCISILLNSKGQKGRSYGIEIAPFQIMKAKINTRDCAAHYNGIKVPECLFIHFGSGGGTLFNTIPNNLNLKRINIQIVVRLHIYHVLSAPPVDGRTLRK